MIRTALWLLQHFLEGFFYETNFFWETLSCRCQTRHKSSGLFAEEDRFIALFWLGSLLFAFSSARQLRLQACACIQMGIDTFLRARWLLFYFSLSFLLVSSFCFIFWVLWPVLPFSLTILHGRSCIRLTPCHWFWLFLDPGISSSKEASMNKEHHRGLFWWPSGWDAIWTFRNFHWRGMWSISWPSDSWTSNASGHSPRLFPSKPSLVQGSSSSEWRWGLQVLRRCLIWQASSSRWSFPLRWWARTGESTFWVPQGRLVAQGHVSESNPLHRVCWAF